MDQPTYPLRVRLYGGRNTHAAGMDHSGTHYKDRITACGHFLAAYSTNHWLPPTAVVTCRHCVRTLNRAGGA